MVIRTNVDDVSSLFKRIHTRSEAAGGFRDYAKAEKERPMGYLCLQA